MEPSEPPGAPPASGPPHLEVRPAPVLELCYAYYFLARPSRQPGVLPWQVELQERPPPWLEAARARPKALSGYEALLLACAFGYDADDAPERFLADLPGLSEAMLAEFDAVFDPGRTEPTDIGGGHLTQLRLGFQALDVQRALELAEHLGHLWGRLRPAWEEHGLRLSAEASEALLASVGPGNDLVSSLPAHHFVNLEDSAAAIRSHQQRGRTLVVPLYFAMRGGFKALLRGRLCIGYGVRTEHFYEEQKERVTRLAGQLKAFSDPTRLLLLFQVARLARFPLTVGDLARQLGVSQPTASGHLRLLRELELVHVVRRGNRSYYRLDQAAVRAAIHELQQLLVGPG